MSQIWDNILFSSDKGVFRITEGKVSQLLDHKDCYGITWNENQNIFVSSYKNVFKLNKKFNIDINQEACGTDLHQAFYRPKDFLYVCSARSGYLAKIQVAEQKFISKAFHFEHSGSHLNSIFFKDGKWYMCIHNKCKTNHCVEKQEFHSFLLEMSPEFEQLRRWSGVGCGNHNVYVENNKLYTLNSVFSKFVKIDMETDERKEVNIEPIDDSDLFPRGLARNDEFFYVGAAQREVRDKRRKIRGYILIYNKNMELVDHLKLPDMHHIRDIRLINQVDHAHNGIILKI